MKNEIVLSNRLETLISMVKPCKNMADVGCDHGFVTIKLLKNNICEHIYAMDVNKGPIERAGQNLNAYNISEKQATLICANGLEGLKCGMVDSVFIAGMGGPLMAGILKRGEAVAKACKQLVLQPQSEIDEFRTFLVQNGYFIEDEKMVYEEGIFYPMMSVRPLGTDEKPYALTKAELEYGPVLLKKRDLILKDFLDRSLRLNVEIIENLKREILASGTTPDNEQKRNRLALRVEELGRKNEMIKECLKSYEEV